SEGFQAKPFLLDDLVEHGRALEYLHLREEGIGCPQRIRGCDIQASHDATPHIDQADDSTRPIGGLLQPRDGTGSRDAEEGNAPYDPPPPPEGGDEVTKPNLLIPALGADRERPRWWAIRSRSRGCRLLPGDQIRHRAFMLGVVCHRTK